MKNADVAKFEYLTTEMYGFTRTLLLYKLLRKLPLYSQRDSRSTSDIYSRRFTKMISDDGLITYHKLE
jgi:hypothetical protein